MEVLAQLGSIAASRPLDEVFALPEIQPFGQLVTRYTVSAASHSSSSVSLLGSLSELDASTSAIGAILEHQVSALVGVEDSSSATGVLLGAALQNYSADKYPIRRSRCNALLLASEKRLAET